MPRPAASVIPYDPALHLLKNSRMVAPAGPVWLSNTLGHTPGAQREIFIGEGVTLLEVPCGVFGDEFVSGETYILTITAIDSNTITAQLREVSVYE